MRRVHQVASLLFLGLGVYVVIQARAIQYSTPLGPGPGFFPFWLGSLMVLLAAVWFGQISYGPVESVLPDFLPDQGGALRVLAITLALALFTGLVDRIGYCLSMFAFSLGLLLGVGRHKAMISCIISVAGSFGVYYVFRYWLGVQLPPSSVQFLANSGF